MTTTRSFPRPTLRRSAIVPLLVLVALVGGPLGFAPAQAATSTVSGVVVDSTGAPVEEAWIGVYQRDDEDETYYVDDSAETFTDESGHYALELARPAPTSSSSRATASTSRSSTTTQSV